MIICIICDLLIFFCFNFVCSYADNTEHRDDYVEEQTLAERLAQVFQENKETAKKVSKSKNTIRIKTETGTYLRPQLTLLPEQGQDSVCSGEGKLMEIKMKRAVSYVAIVREI